MSDNFETTYSYHDTHVWLFRWWNRVGKRLEEAARAAEARA